VGSFLSGVKISSHKEKPHSRALVETGLKKPGGDSRNEPINTNPLELHRSKKEATLECRRRWRQEDYREGIGVSI